MQHGEIISIKPGGNKWVLLNIDGQMHMCTGLSYGSDPLNAENYFTKISTRGLNLKEIGSHGHCCAYAPQMLWVLLTETDRKIA
jgi:hypothetical protein